MVLRHSGGGVGHLGGRLDVEGVETLEKTMFTLKPEDRDMIMILPDGENGVIVKSGGRASDLCRSDRVSPRLPGSR